MPVSPLGARSARCRALVLSIASIACLGAVAPTVSAQPRLTVHGSAAGERFGQAVAILGDTNGDGIGELLVGAPAIGPGNARLLSGAAGTLLRTFTGESAGDFFGASVANAGDTDGDGVDDVLVGAPGDDNQGADSGSARLFSGATGAVRFTFEGSAAGDQHGASVRGAGDVDGDGYDDVLVGAPGNDAKGQDAGAAVVYSGRTGAVLHTLRGASAGDDFGRAVSGAGDLNGDGFADLLVGAPRHDAPAGVDCGSATAFSGATGNALFTFRGSALRDFAGTSVAGLGDTNGDGVDDVAVGVTGDDAAGPDAGAVYLLSGSGGSVLRSVVGIAPQDGLGFAVAALGDADGDGRGDLVAGAPANDRNGTGCGLAQAYSGATGKLLQSHWGSAEGDALGSSVAGGDVDGDGYGDWLAGARGDDDNGQNAGSASLLGQRPFDGFREVKRHAPALPNAVYGWTIRGLGDINRDGTPDYAVGAPAPNQRGTVLLYSGADHSLLHQFAGPTQTATWFGVQVAAVGDLDGDSHPDIGIGAIQYDASGLSDAGLVDIYSGRTLQLLSQRFGPVAGANLGTAVENLGDVDGDQVDDYLLGLGKHNSGTGAAWVYSGATHSRIVPRSFFGRQQGEWFGWSAAALGDVDGDGVDDVAIGAPSGETQPAALNGYVAIYSGASGALVRLHLGPTAGSRFGWDVARAGDVNADGVPDLIVGAPQHDVSASVADAGFAQVFSGKTGVTLYQVIGTTAGEQLGAVVGAAGDANGDGYGDFLVGAPKAQLAGSPRGQVRVLSGFDGSELHSFWGAAPSADLQVGAHLGDLDGDGRPALATGGLSPPLGGGNGEVRVYEVELGRDPGLDRRYGAPCIGSAGRLPRNEVSGRPAIGQTFTSSVRAAPASTAAAWGLGVAPTNFDLTAFGMPTCRMLTVPVFNFPFPTNAAGRIDVPVPVPNTPALVGGRVYIQWALVDTAANRIGVITSDGREVALGK